MHFCRTSVTMGLCSFQGLMENDDGSLIRRDSTTWKYHCPYCEHSSVRKDHMRDHIHVHTGCKPYQCSFCSKTFCKKTNLDRHVRTHTGEKPHRCDYCSYSCVQSTQLKSHMMMHHGDLFLSWGILNFIIGWIFESLNTLSLDVERNIGCLCTIYVPPRLKD